MVALMVCISALSLTLLWFLSAVCADASVLSLLRSLTVSEGHLDPSFHPSKTTYHVHVGHEITTVTIQAVAAHCNCQTRIGSRGGQTRQACH
jgi:hypothetical protein